MFAKIINNECPKPENAEAWSARVIINVCNDFLRRLRHDREVLKTLTAIAGSNSGVAIRTPYFDSAEEVKLVLALATPSERAVLQLYLKGKTLTEIAELEGVTVPTIRGRLKTLSRRCSKDGRADDHGWTVRSTTEDEPDLEAPAAPR